MLTGDDPPDLVAAHQPGTCHDPLCVNPHHLRWATPSDNALDRHGDGTSATGSKNGNAKLSDSDVSDIRRALAAGADTPDRIAQRFGIHPVYARAIAKGRARPFG